MQKWFALSDPAMEEALYEIASLCNFAGLKLSEPIPDETTILNFRHMLEEYNLAGDILKQVNALFARKGLLLKRGSIVAATIIAAPSSTKNADGKRDPEMHQTKKGNQWYFGMKRDFTRSFRLSQHRLGRLVDISCEQGGHTVVWLHFPSEHTVNADSKMTGYAHFIGKKSGSY